MYRYALTFFTVDFKAADAGCVDAEIVEYAFFAAVFKVKLGVKLHIPPVSEPAVEFCLFYFGRFYFLCHFYGVAFADAEFAAGSFRGFDCLPFAVVKRGQIPPFDFTARVIDAAAPHIVKQDGGGVTFKEGADILCFFVSFRIGARVKHGKAGGVSEAGDIKIPHSAARRVLHAVTENESDRVVAAFNEVRYIITVKIHYVVGV